MATARIFDVMVDTFEVPPKNKINKEYLILLTRSLNRFVTVRSIDNAEAQRTRLETAFWYGLYLSSRVFT
jgi:hypothetical protein